MAYIFKGQFGGLADSKYSGIEGSFYRCVGVDGHSTPGQLKVHQKLTKDSGSTVDAFVKVSLAASNGYSFWFSATSGKIWARASNGTWTLAYTTVAGAGTHGCSGAMEFNGYIYWATQSRLHRIAIANADDAWASVDLNWATFTATDADFHPMAIQDLTLFIGDANLVAEVSSAGSFTANVLDLKTPYRIKTMIPYDIDLLIGTYIADTVNLTEIIRWDTVSTSWNTSDPIEEVGINSFIRDDNYVYANAGLAGNMYLYDGSRLIPYKKVPGTYSSTAYGSVHPNASANFKGIPVFGFSNGSGNPALEGVYSFGSYSRDYPKVMDLSWVISQDLTSGVEIGAITVLGFDLMVSWKEGSNFGVDKIDYTAKYASAYVESRMLYEEMRDVLKTLADLKAFYDSLPASCGVTFSYSINNAAYVALTDVDDTKLAACTTKTRVSEIGSLQIKMAFNVSVNNAPTIEGIQSWVDGENDDAKQ